MRSKLSLFILPFVVAAAAACGAGRGEKTAAVEREVLPAREPAAVEVTRQAVSRSAAEPLVVFLGDSLTAGLGLAEEQAYPAVLAGRLARAGRPVRMVNAGVSGDTTAGGLARLDWLLSQSPAVVVVALGANDGLRGLPLQEIDHNLREIIRRCRQAGASVLLLGMQIPPNYGRDYAGGFAALYPRIAADLGVPLVPFLLAGVGGVPELNQGDGIHPTAAGQEKVADNVEPLLAKVLAAQGRPAVSVPAK